MQFTDSVTVAGTRRTGDGYLIADAKAVRTGIQTYLGSEVGRPDMPIVRVYRSEDEVRNADSLRSFSHAPVTVDHPSVAVNSENWKDLAVGEVSTAATWDGNRISLPLILKDAKAIETVGAGKRELSAGYTCDLDWTAGTTADGQAYDAQQTNIRANHVAIVHRGRAGPECRIGDADPHKWGVSPITIQAMDKGARSMTTRTIVVDGLSVELADKDAQIVQRTIDGLTKKVEDGAKALSDAEKSHAEAISAKDKELGTKDAEIETLKANQMDAAKLDQMVADRAEVVAKAKALDAKVETKGIKDADIRRKAVAAKLGDAKVEGKSDDYVGALFDHLTADLKPTDALAAAFSDSQPTVDARSDAMKKRDDRLANAWKPKAA